ncbi:MAG: ComEC/Rec2 family competence protein [Candidatus Omnitrophota bacterium]|nr:ComEC/Rec2 family competence protein [Candidatus Omnitrophota bacterium]
MKRPLVILAVFYVLGIILAGLIRLDFWLVMGVAIVVFACVSLGVREKHLFLVSVLFLALLAGGLNLKNSHRLPGCHIRNFVAHKDNAVYCLNGFIASQPEFKNDHLWFILRARQIQADKLRYKCCGEVLVKMDFKQALNYGENLTLIGGLGRPQVFSRSQGYRDFLARQGIYLIMPIQNHRQIIRQDKFSGGQLIRGCLWLRFYLEQIISRHLPALPASILSAMVLGQKQGIPWLVSNSMIKAGTVHILVVSGFNVGIVAFVINLLLKILRLPRKGRIILTAICLLIYCLITGATNPVIRATVMGLVFLAAYLLKREADIYNSLVSAALFILVINPRQLFDVGFQLSFISVLAIVYFYPKLKARVHLESCKIKILKFIIEGCLVSFSAWLGTLVIIALNFRIIAPVTVLANILIVPLATLITLCGFILVLSGLIYPDLANLFSLPTMALITLLLNINASLIKLPGAYIYF